MRFQLSRHAQEEMGRRSIPAALVERVLQNPDQVVSEREGRKAYQSRFDLGGGSVFLVRAIVNNSVDPATVVTVYRTTRISKYWRTT